MNFKTAGVILVSLCGLYFSYNVKRKYDKRIKVLEDFIKDFEFFINEISFLMTPVNEIILKLKKVKNNKIYDLMLNGRTEEIRNTLLFDEYYLTNKDACIITDFFKMLGTSDYINQINSLKSQKELLKGQLKEAKGDKEKNQKSLTSLTMCSFVMIIIFLF